jgi:hypothetical protein
VLSLQSDSTASASTIARIDHVPLTLLALDFASRPHFESTASSRNINLKSFTLTASSYDMSINLIFGLPSVLQWPQNNSDQYWPSLPVA